MNFRTYLSAAALLSSVFLLSCGEGDQAGDGQHADTTAGAAAGQGLSVSLEDVPDIQQFPDAGLALGNVSAVPSGDSVKLSFTFNVRNYELKNQTADSVSKLCNNSAQGQHIHFILDNRPYVALYEPKHETTVAKNSEHYMLAFLSRSYHLSLKQPGVAVLYRFKVDENGKLQKLEDPGTPMVFYSRPKGDYLGKDTENILLDFYVWNATLGSDYQVRADITAAGGNSSLTISDWKPYFLKNLPMGKTTIKLSLVGKDGNKVEGVNTEVSREINLSQDEPMQP